MKTTIKIIKDTFLFILAIIAIIFDRIILFLAFWKEIPSIPQYIEFEYLMSEMITRIVVVLILIMLVIAIWTNIHYFNLYMTLIQ